ncbi:MAG: glycosyltransferase family 4 protein [Clostridia bacterium]|nr:glycosyltransferase family 4 protein [Clostridia bacterium]
MKVLLLSVRSAVSKGGIATWTERYLDACDQAGFSCDLVNMAAVGKIAIQATSKRNLWDEFRRTVRMHRHLSRALKTDTYDVAHLNTSIGLFGIIRDYGLAKRIHKRGIPIVLHFHCDISFWTQKTIIRRYLGKILKLTAANFVLCDNSARYLQEQYGADSVKVPNFVDDTLMIDGKEIRDDLKTVCFVGRITDDKGATELYEAARCHPDVRFDLVGEVSAQMAEQSPPDNVRFLGLLPHNEVITVLDAADAFVFPTHSEGFSLALAEAMARGLPCIVTDVGANADMVEDKGGVVVPARDAEAFSAALDAIQDPKTRHQMSEWNIQKVNEQYLTATLMQRFADEYRKLTIK